MAAYRWKIKRIELKESCEQHGFAWSDVDDIMRFWCQISKTRIHDDLIEEWIGDDEQIMVDDDESSSVQPAPSNISSNVGKGPQQPSIADDNERMLEEVSDPSPPGNNITDSVVFVQSAESFLPATSSSSAETALPAPSSSSAEIALPATSSSSAETSSTAKDDIEEVDVEKMMVDNDESSSLQTLINPEASFSSTSTETLPRDKQ